VGKTQCLSVKCDIHNDSWAVKSCVKNVCTRDSVDPAAVNLFLISVMIFLSFIIGTDEIILDKVN